MARILFQTVSEIDCRSQHRARELGLGSDSPVRPRVRNPVPVATQG